jgi:hypothetical protein
LDDPVRTEEERAKEEERLKRELLKRLTQINSAQGLSLAEAEIRAEMALGKIVRAMWRAAYPKRSEIDGHADYHGRIDDYIRGLEPPDDWIHRLVEHEGQSVILGAKRRAIQLLKGGRPNSRKNKIELQAVELADKIRGTWLALRGRRQGVRKMPQGRDRDCHIELVVVRDAVKIAAEAIQRHAGTEIDWSDAKAKAALMAAILILRPDAERSIDREITSYLAAPTTHGNL